MLDEVKEARNHAFSRALIRERLLNQTPEDGYGCEEEDGPRAEEATCQEGKGCEGPGCDAQEGEAPQEEEVSPGVGASATRKATCSRLPPSPGDEATGQVTRSSR